jgi:transposase
MIWVYQQILSRLDNLEAENLSLNNLVIRQNTEIASLRSLLEAANAKLNKNSSNSSKPPSSDMIRTKSLRKSSGKARGGQQYHPGSTLPFSSTPAHVVDYFPSDNCCCCGQDLKHIEAHGYDRRQVFDIPPVKMEVTEHKAFMKCCPHCHTENKGVFPCTVSQPVQYGNNLKRFAIYQSAYQFIPFRRTAQMIKDFTGHGISEGTLVNFINQFQLRLNNSGFEKALKEQLLACDQVHFDETGFHYDNERNWLHVATTDKYTYYFPHFNRGSEAMNAMEILPQYLGIAMHDYWKSYLQYGCTHALCNVHHLRDLTFCEEHENSGCATKLKALLLEIKAGVDTRKTEGFKNMEEAFISEMEAKYDAIVAEGYEAHPMPIKEEGKKGVVKKSKTQNLLERFKNHKDDILRFMKDFRVPFGNNVAEQAMRMMKLKQKISGCFRSQQGAVAFAAIRSYIDTARKHGFSVYEAILSNIEMDTLFPWTKNEKVQPSG